MRIQHFPHKHRKNANVRHKTKIATHLLKCSGDNLLKVRNDEHEPKEGSVTWLGCSSEAELMLGICEDMDQ